MGYACKDLGPVGGLRGGAYRKEEIEKGRGEAGHRRWKVPVSKGGEAVIFVKVKNIIQHVGEPE